MSPSALDHLSPENLRILEERDIAIRDLIADPKLYFGWRPCEVRVLIVVDGLDFDPVNLFGLSQFVKTILDTGWYVSLAITLAGLQDIRPADAGMLPNEPRIAARIGKFRFDNPDHFSHEKYDIIFLFGIESTYGGWQGRGQETLNDAELRAITMFQNRGGGLFATGDHGDLGRALCSKVPRASDMRLWRSTDNQLGEDMVSMFGRYRNDTNRRGHDLDSQFSDQSDDIPQPIDPVFYTSRSLLWRYRFPHPLLCGPEGVIGVMPDHPHEGECKLPSDTERQIHFMEDLGPEFPAGLAGGARPLPEIVSYNHVPAGNSAKADYLAAPKQPKSPTIAQTFPGICAYDGHRAGIGRVVTDATWHHFVNVNLTGIPEAPLSEPKRKGFLATTRGQAVFEEIKAYYRNLVLWLCPPSQIRCMRSRLLWTLIWREHVLEAVLTARTVGIERVDSYTLSLIGQHARDALGRYASQCEARKLMIDLLEVTSPLLPLIDPWMPRLEDETEIDQELPLFDMDPMLDAALGGALVAIADRFPEPSRDVAERLDAEEIFEIARRGAAFAMDKAQQSLKRGLDLVAETMLRNEPR